MELTLAPLHKGQIFWRGLLLTVSLLTCWNSPTAARNFTLEAVPPIAAVGNLVFLFAHGVADITNFQWEKAKGDNHGMIIPIMNGEFGPRGPAFRRHFQAFRNGTLLFRNVEKNDAGSYKLTAMESDGRKEEKYVELHVYYPVTQPSILVTNTTVKNMISVFLTCLSNDTGVSIDWFFKGQSVNLTERIHLSHNNITLQIDSVRIEDSGDYQCQVSNEVSSKMSVPIQLDIIRERAKPEKYRPSSKVVIGIVAQCLLGLIAVIFLLVFLWRRQRGREPRIGNDIIQMRNQPTNLNETSKAASNVKTQKIKK